MDKSKIFKSSILLILVGLITKIFASVAKIVMARNLTTNAMGIYMLVVPMYIFFINVIQLSLPTTIATKIAKNPKQTNKIIISSSAISLVVNVVFMILIYTFSSYIASTILKNPEARLSIISLSLLVPLISLGGLIKGYYMGIGKIEVSAYSQISEEIARIIFIILFVNIFKDKGDAYLAYGAFLSLCAGEIFSLSHMLIAMPNIKNKPKLFAKGVTNKENYIIKDILHTAVPLTGGKLISTIAYSLEPIIMSSVLSKLGYDLSYVTGEYGVISGLVFPLLLMPGFFASSLARVLLQPLTTSIAQNEYTKAKKLTISITLTSFFIGLFFCVLLLMFPKFIMSLLYGGHKGYEYIKIFALPFVFYYIEAPLISVMMVISNSKKIMFYDSLVSIIRLVSLYVLLHFVGILAIPISTIINTTLLVIFFLIETIVFFKKKDNTIIQINKS